MIYSSAQLKLSKAKTRKNHLVDALFDGRIDQRTYDEQLVRLDEESQQIQLELREAESDFLDLEGVLKFAEKIISRPSRLWIESSLDQRQRLQTLFFPAGLTFDGEEFGTGITSPFFNVLEGFSDQEDLFGVPDGIRTHVIAVKGRCPGPG